MGRAAPFASLRTIRRPAGIDEGAPIRRKIGVDDRPPWSLSGRDTIRDSYCHMRISTICFYSSWNILRQRTRGAKRPYQCLAPLRFSAASNHQNPFQICESYSLCYVSSTDMARHASPSTRDGHDGPQRCVQERMALHCHAPFEALIKCEPSPEKRPQKI